MLEWMKKPLMQKLATDDEVLSNPGLLLDFKLLKTSSNSSSWRVYFCNTVFETSLICWKSLEDVGIEDSSLEQILVKKLLNPLAILFDQ